MGLGFYNLKVLCAYFLPKTKDSRLLTVILDRAEYVATAPDEHEHGQEHGTPSALAHESVAHSERARRAQRRGTHPQGAAAHPAYGGAGGPGPLSSVELMQRLRRDGALNQRLAAHMHAVELG